MNEKDFKQLLVCLNLILDVNVLISVLKDLII